MDVQRHVSERGQLYFTTYTDESLQRSGMLVDEHVDARGKASVLLNTQARMPKTCSCISDSAQHAGLRLWKHLVMFMRMRACNLELHSCIDSGVLLTSQSCDIGNAASCS